jgi:hypothetical protein
MNETNGSNGNKPTLNEFDIAWHFTKGYDMDGIKTHEGFSSTEIKTEDHASAMFRHHLGERWRSIPLDTIRDWALNESRAGHEWGPNKRTNERNIELAIARLIEESKRQRSEYHSPGYDAIHNSDEFKRIVADLKREYEWTCQMCNQNFRAENLEGHITDYHEWRKPGKILILCADMCHPIADVVLRHAKSKDPNDGIDDLFTMTEYHE